MGNMANLCSIQVKCSGPGIASTGVPASIPVEFQIDASEAGDGVLAVQVTVSLLQYSACQNPTALSNIKKTLLDLYAGF